MKVYYTPQMLGPAHAVSPSAYKPAEVLASWLHIAPSLEVIEPAPVTVSQLVVGSCPKAVSPTSPRTSPSQRRRQR